MIGVPRQYVHAASESADLLESDKQALEAELDSCLDDRTVAYVLKMRPCFDSLRQAAAQLAGLLVLASTGGRSQVLDLPMLEMAVEEQSKAEAMLRDVTIPSPASHHHFHLSRAAAWIGEALQLARIGSLRNDDTALDSTLEQLRAGWREIHSATRALPGFQVVDFNQACCATHANPKVASAGIR